MVPDAREILDAAAADQHDGVLLQVVADARNVGRHLNAVGEAHAGDLTKSRIGLLGGLCVHAGADAAALGRTLQGGAGGLVAGGRAALLDELMKRWHWSSFAAISQNSSAACLDLITPRSRT